MKNSIIPTLAHAALLALLAAAGGRAQNGRLDSESATHGQQVVLANGSEYRAVKTRTEQGWERLVATPQGKRWVRCGLFTKYRSDGSIRERATYRDGALHGARTTYHPNGRPQFHYGYVQGKRQGLATLHRDDGTLEEEATFVDDLKHGTHRHYEQFAGERRVSKVIDYVGGKQHGHEVKYRVADGAILWRNTYVNGVRVGTERWSPPATSLTPRQRGRMPSRTVK
jgi:antitoxin component YwqK of YwqJK toxin-antitoxin module